ncbi:RDD family protein [Umezawaea tangerina]|uniref:Putative RDD family membrane protein YckC n=1 Tax=Umezawaea tangerina TaxID=84725 RepID=A0A2T0T769_9PSEU|nr:RDD family protein [Umezawaea tangerina]PRY41515.1 putative RDD family membrane protein YckC [Umezawaea tangerina]
MTVSAGFAPPKSDTARSGVVPGRLEALARRTSQHVLDSALAIGLGFLAGLLVGVVVIPLMKWGVVPPRAILWAPTITFVAVAFVSQLLIDIWVPSRRHGVTPGMLVMGLRVEKVDGGEPSIWDYLIRSLLFAVDGTLLGLVAVVSILVTKRRQRVGDLLARTVVVRVGGSTGVVEPGSPASRS